MGEAEEEEVLVEKEKEEDREREAMKGGEAFSNHTLPFSTPLISAPSSLLRHWWLCRPTVVWNKQEYRRKYGPLARPFARTGRQPSFVPLTSTPFFVPHPPCSSRINELGKGIG